MYRNPPPHPIVPATTTAIAGGLAGILDLS
jgi:hypothetical protein